MSGAAAARGCIARPATLQFEAVSASSEVSLVPRRWVLAGRQRASGLLVDPAALGESVARARVLAAWSAGTVVSALDTGELVVEWPEPRALFADASPGAPLVLRDAAYVAVPLDPREWEALAPVPPGAVVRAREGALLLETERRKTVDPSAWIEVDGVAVEAVTSLGAPPPPIAPALSPPSRSLRAQLLPPEAREPDAEAAMVLAELRGGAEVEARPGWRARWAAALRTALGRGERASPGAAGAGLLSRLRAALRRDRSTGAAGAGLISRLRAALRRPSSPPEGAAPPSRDRAVARGAEGARPSWLSRLRAALSSSAAPGRGPAARGSSAEGGARARGRAALGAREASSASGGPPSLLARLRAALGGSSASPADPGAPTGRASLWRRLASRVRGPAAAAHPAPGSVGVSPLADEAPPGPVTRALRRLSRYLAMSRWAGQRSARYLTDMLDKFERGDLTEALRHAIPLGKGDGPPDREPSWGAPTPRANLQISPKRGTPRGSLLASDDLYEHLRRTYRAALQRLEREGNIEQAAFVLAELLGEVHEAVALLERHGRVRLAAELAEGRALEPALVVRQWVIAQDLDRAVLLARRHGVFAGAIHQLERSHRALADRLRLTWADLTASAGDFAQAVEIVWPLADARALARAWIDRAIDVGGVVGARMLARKVELAPEEYDELWERTRALCVAADATQAPAREALARALLEVDNEAARRLVHPITRALLRDRSAGANALTTRELRALADHARDAALRVDVPEVRTTVPDAHHFAHRIEPRDVGRTPLYDAVRLPNGQLVVACGEGGVRWISREGKPVAHFDVPAHRLVLSDHGDRLLAVAPRGGSSMVSKIDLHERRARLWLDLPLVGHAETFDGATWYVLEAGAVSAIDLMSPRLSSLWRVQVDGSPARVARDLARVCFTVTSPEGTEVWSYELPSMSLRSRREVQGAGTVVVGAGGHTAVLSADGVHGSDGLSLAAMPGAEHHATIGASGALAWVHRAGETTRVEVFEDRVRRGWVELGGGVETFARLQGRDLLVGDRAGRLLVRSPEHPGRRIDLRL